MIKRSNTLRPLGMTSDLFSAANTSSFSRSFLFSLLLVPCVWIQVSLHLWHPALLSVDSFPHYADSHVILPDFFHAVIWTIRQVLFRIFSVKFRCCHLSLNRCTTNLNPNLSDHSHKASSYLDLRVQTTPSFFLLQSQMSTFSRPKPHPGITSPSLCVYALSHRAL